ncbi:aldehyde dehydrogenase family protein [Sphingomonas sp. CJ20]
MAEPQRFQRNAPLIAGRWLDQTSLGTIEHRNPATNRVQAQLHVGGAAEIDAAVTAAVQGQRAWADLPGDRRRTILERWATLIDGARAELVQLIALESGTPVMLGGGVDLALAWIRYYAGWADRLVGDVVEPIGAPGLNYTRHEPYGVVGLIIPWNSPLVASAMKVVPALAAGNGAVLKPPTLTPFVALRLAELALEAGLPDGVFNVVPGDAEAGNALVAHPDIAKISFTGGEQVGRVVMRNCAEYLKPLALELGGKSANLIFADADLDAAAQMAAIHGTAVLTGQGCVLPTRAYVHDSVYDAFVARVKAVTESLAVGDPLDPTSFVGPVINRAASDRILGVIDRARRDGAELVTGGEKLGGALAEGNFIAPTVFGNVRHESDLAQNEVFGPVLAISRFSDDDDALAKANDTRFGLGAYVHTRDLARAHRLAAKLKAGAIAVNSGPPMAPNTPFGGYKQSGFGREGGKAGIDEFLQQKNIYIPF